MKDKIYRLVTLHDKNARDTTDNIYALRYQIAGEVYEEYLSYRRSINDLMWPKEFEYLDWLDQQEQE